MNTLECTMAGHLSDTGNVLEGTFLDLVLSFQHSSRIPILPPNQVVIFSPFPSYLQFCLSIEAERTFLLNGAWVIMCFCYILP